MKKISALSLILTFTFSIHALEVPAFSGYMGLLGEGSLNDEIYGSCFASGQLDFGGNLFIRGEASLKTDNFIEKNLLDEPSENNSKFRIQELSATYKLNTGGMTHFFSGFLGNFEPIGSDAFLKRQFGINGITSPLTESYSGSIGDSFNSFYGAGGAYTMKFPGPFATGIYAYYNRNENSNNLRSASCADLRFAGAFPYFTFDLCGGVNFPFENESKSGDKVLFLVEELLLNGGLNVLIGNRYTTSLFLQAELNDVLLSPNTVEDSVFDEGMLYLLAELRIVGATAQLNASVFNIPDDYMKELVYFRLEALEAAKTAAEKGYDADTKRSTLGLNVRMFTQSIYLGSTALTAGLNGTLTVPSWGIFDAYDDFSEFNDMDKTFVLSPFVTAPLMGGSLTGITSVNLTSIGDSVKDSFWFMLGYKTQF